MAQDSKPAGQPDGTYVRPGQNLWLGVAWTALSLFCFVGIALTGRESGKLMPALHVTFYRNFFALIILLTWIHVSGTRLSSLVSVQPGWQMARAAAHFAGQWTWIHAVVLIPFFELAALEFTAPLWVALLAPMMLKEKLTKWRVLSAVLGFVGALILIRPGSASLNAGTFMALLAALLFSLNVIGARYLSRYDAPMTTQLFMCVFHSVVGFILCLPTFQLPPLAALPWVIAMGVASLGAHYCLTRALMYADAMVVAPLDFLRLPLMAFVGWVVYHETLSSIALLGTAVVIGGNLINMWHERPGKKRA